MYPLSDTLQPLSVPSRRIPWYLAGGVPRSNCLAAYQPKGAVDLATSYVNLVTPGTYNAAPGVAPEWDVSNGWKFNSSNRWLDTGVAASIPNYSMIVRFSNSNTDVSGQRAICGAYMTGFANWFSIYNRYLANNVLGYVNGTTVKQVSRVISSGVMAIAGLTGYYNGIPESGSLTSGSGTTWTVCIGANAFSETSASQYTGAYVQAFAIYNAVLSATQIEAITNFMNLL